MPKRLSAPARSNPSARQKLQLDPKVAILADMLRDGKPRTAGALCQRFNVHSRTIRRWIHHLRDELKMPIESTRFGFVLAKKCRSKS